MNNKKLPQRSTQVNDETEFDQFNNQDIQDLNDRELSKDNNFLKKSNN